MTLTGHGPLTARRSRRTVTTGPGGTYSFDLLPAGTYTITQGSISEAYLTDGQTAAGSEGGTVAPTVISAITLPANTAATDYLFPKVPQARVAIAKAVQAGPTVNPDGSFTVTFRLNVQNFSLEALTDVEVTDALEGAAPLFGTYVGSTPTTPGTYTMAAAPTGSCGGLNASYNGAGDQVVATGFGMPATSTCFIDLQLQVIPTNPPPPLLAGGARYLNQAEIDATGAVSGQTSATNPQLTDLSDNGTSPDPDGDGQGNEAGENDPTPLALDLTAGIRLVKSLSALADTNGNGRVDPGDTATYSFAVTNTGQVLLANVTVTDPLVTVSGGPITLGVGETNSTAFTASYVLTQDDIDRGYVENTALTEGDAVAADGSPILDDLGNPVTVSDVSDTGTDATGAPVGSPETTETPDGTGGTDGDPTNDPTVIVLSQTPGVVLEKRLVSVTDTTGDGLIGDGDTAAYAFTVTNTGLVRLIDVTVTDPLVTMSGGPIDLAVGASDSTSFTATYVITQADVDRGFVDNSATVTGTAATSAGDPILGPGGVPITVSDISDTGTAPDGSAVAAPATTETVSAGGVTDADPTNDPTSFLLSPSASIQLVKRNSGTTDVNGNGIVDLGDIVNYAFEVTNTGNVTLAGVTVTDPIVTVAGGPITLAPGATDSTTFTASYTLVADDITRTYVQNTATADGNAVTVGGDPIPGAGGGPLTATDISDTGTAPDGSTVTDPETTETPDALGGTDGDPTNDPTVIRVGIPEIELDIEIADILDTNGKRHHRCGRHHRLHVHGDEYRHGALDRRQHGPRVAQRAAWVDLHPDLSAGGRDPDPGLHREHLCHHRLRRGGGHGHAERYRNRGIAHGAGRVGRRQRSLAGTWSGRDRDHQDGRPQSGQSGRSRHLHDHGHQHLRLADDGHEHRRRPAARLHLPTGDRCAGRGRNRTVDFRADADLGGGQPAAWRQRGGRAWGSGQRERWSGRS